MPRITRELAAQKEAFVTNLVKENPSITLLKIQEAVKTQFGASMNLKKLTELRKLAAGTEVAATPVEAPATTTEPVATTETAPAQVVEVPVVVETVPVALAATPEPVVTVLEQVTDEKGTHLREPQPTTGAEVEIRPGLTEVIAVTATAFILSLLSAFI